MIIFFIGTISFYNKNAEAKSESDIKIIFTHDMHDHLEAFNLEKNNEVSKYGGFARIKTAINEEKKKDSEALVLDAGDYSMGTLFQSAYTTDALELKMLGKMGFDATTFGNHEFDFKAEGLAKDLNAAKESGEKLPQIVQCNIAFPKDKNGKLPAALKDLKDSMKNYGVKDYTILNRHGMKIGIFGLMGKNAASDSPLAGVEFTDQIKNAKRVVSTLKNKEKVDLIICLSHSGTSDKKSKSEDEILAKEVPDINVIISGHSHTKLSKPIITGNTTICSCGEYGENLGVIDITKTSKNSWKLNNYKLLAIDDKYEEDPEITKTINGYKDIVQNKYLNNYDLKFDQVIGSSSFNFTSIDDLEKYHKEDALGNFISDSYTYAVKKAEGDNYDKIAMTVIPAGIIRSSFVKGNITAADAFSTSSLGLGKDNLSGYPLISVYFTGKEIKTICEVDASISPLMPDVQLFMSGISYTFNPNRLIFNKVTKCSLIDENNKLQNIDDKKLYRVIADLYSGQMLSLVGKESYGILSLEPKTKDGIKITDFNSQIISYNNKELKGWQAIAEYLQSFKKVNGVSTIPDYYKTTHNRKIIDNSHNIIRIIQNPNSFAILLCTIVFVIILLISFIIYRFVTRKKRREKLKLKS